ncbi:MAG: inositol monophosphatase [Bacteroidales bacterium]|nr:inositol monophosphatase [Bacteroidales bacterium]
MNYKNICQQTVELAIETGKYIEEAGKAFSVKNIEIKGKHNFVTEVDKTAEKKIISGLEKILPDSGFIAEEGTTEKKERHFTWIVDPLDGTTNFIHGAPPVAISIALMEKDEIVIGVVYEISYKECFYTYKGGAAYLNGKEISVSATSSVSESLIATGFPYSNFGRLRSFMSSLKYLFNNTHGVRRLGSAATDLAYVACGRYDGFYEYNLNPWDVAAGAYLIQQAGGKVSDFKGKNNYIFGEEIVAANFKTFEEFRKIIGDFMNT